MSNCVGSVEFEHFVAGLAWEVRYISQILLINLHHSKKEPIQESQPGMRHSSTIGIWGQMNYPRKLSSKLLSFTPKNKSFIMLNLTIQNISF